MIVVTQNKYLHPGVSQMRKFFCFASLVLLITVCGAFFFFGVAFGGVPEGQSSPSDLWESAKIAEAEGRYREALDLYELELKTRRAELGMESLKTVEAIDSVLRVSFTLGNYHRILELYQESLVAYEKSGNELGAAASLKGLGFVCLTLGDYAKGMEYTERELAIWLKLFGEEHEYTAASLFVLGNIHGVLDDYAKAKEYAERALAIRLKLFGEEHADTAASLFCLGKIYGELGDYAKAKEYHEHALAIRLKLFGEEHADTANSLHNLGNDYHNLGEHAKAKDCYERALAICLKLFGEEHADTAVSLNNLGANYSSLGEHAKAKEYNERALAIRLKLFGEEHADTAGSLNNLGAVFSGVGEYAKAKEYDERALAIRLKLFGEDHADTAGSLNSLGGDYSDLGEYAKAKEYHERALAIRLKLFGDDHADTATSLNNLGNSYFDLGEYAKAKEFYERALAIQLKLFGEEHAFTARLLNNLGIDYGVFGEYAKAKEYGERALAIWLKLFGEEHPDTAVSFSLLGEVYSLMGQKDTAILYKKMAVNITQKIRAKLTSLDKDLQKSFLNSKEYHYETLADLLVEQGRISEAQQVLAMLKEEEFFDFFQRNEKNDQRETRVSYSNIEQKQLDRFREISGQLFARNKEKEELMKKKEAITDTEWNASADAKQLKKVDVALENLTKDLFAFFDKLETALKIEKSRGTEFATGSEYLKDIQATLKKMGHNVTLIHTIVTPEQIWLIVTSPNSPPISRKSLVVRTELNRKILDFRECLKDPRSDPESLTRLARELFGILIKPISEDLENAGAQTLMFSLDGALRFVPMAALHDGKQWLAEKYAVAVYTDAAKSNLKSGREAARWEAMALGVTKAYPPFSGLPAVESEMERIVRKKNAGENDSDGIVPGHIYTDEKFTESAFSSAVESGASVIHVATHFNLEPGTISDSFLLLGGGEKLTLKKIYDDDLNFRQVSQLTLSACETAVGFGEGAGRELEGLGALAQKQGAKSVMATLWSVADASTGLFMPRYYELLIQGMTKAEALRRTQAEFIDGTLNRKSLPEEVKKLRGSSPAGADSADFPEYSHPFYWAPFILMGNWL
jgi:CHAT domain-containing protein/tetratricopeptide (TPR) repeat protein